MNKEMTAIDSLLAHEKAIEIANYLNRPENKKRIAEAIDEAMANIIKKMPNISKQEFEIAVQVTRDMMAKLIIGEALVKGEIK